MDRQLYIYNINPDNYTNLNWKYDYYAMSQGLSATDIPEKIFGIDINNVSPVEFNVKKYYLPDNNIAWLISSNMFKHYYAFLLNPVTHDEVVLKNGIKYYTNVCIKCGMKITSFDPLQKIGYAGFTDAVYLCPRCRNTSIKAMPYFETQRENTKRTELENRISEMLNSINVEYQQEKAINLEIFNKVVDFYIPCGKMIIEGNGLAYHATASTSKMKGKYGRQAFFVNVMKDILSAYELTRRGYYVYIITEADFKDFDEFTSSSANIAPEKIPEYKWKFLKADLEQILSARGCNIKANIFKIEHGKGINFDDEDDFTI